LKPNCRQRDRAHVLGWERAGLKLPARRNVLRKAPTGRTRSTAGPFGALCLHISARFAAVELLRSADRMRNSSLLWRRRSAVARKTHGVFPKPLRRSPRFMPASQWLNAAIPRKLPPPLPGILADGQRLGRYVFWRPHRDLARRLLLPCPGAALKSTGRAAARASAPTSWASFAAAAVWLAEQRRQWGVRSSRRRDYLHRSMTACFLRAGQHVSLPLRRCGDYRDHDRTSDADCT